MPVTGGNHRGTSGRDFSRAQSFPRLRNEEKGIAGETNTYIAHERERERESRRVKE